MQTLYVDAGVSGVASHLSLIAGMALAAHGVGRATQDFDILVLDAGGPGDRLDVRLLLRGPAGAELRAEVESRLAALPQLLRDAWLTLGE